MDGCILQMAGQEIDFHYETISYIAIDRVDFTYGISNE
jgi:hypothetical protein